MKPFYWAICVGILGFVVGASLTALFLSSSAAKQRFVFQQRQKCRELADKWTKENEPEIIGRVDYSIKRNSCIIESERFYDSKEFQTSESFYIRDILTGEVIAFKHCTDSECNQAVKEIVAQFTSLI